MMIPSSKTEKSFLIFFAVFSVFFVVSAVHAAEMSEYPIVKLQSLEKTTARTRTFEARVGSTVKFGPLFIKVQTCQKASPIDKPESAAFLQIWEMDTKDKAQWIFSGWMFASSPGLSSMDHPIYDVWVLDCQQAKGAIDEADQKEDELRGEGEISDEVAPAEPEIEQGAPAQN